MMPAMCDSLMNECVTFVTQWKRPFPANPGLVRAVLQVLIQCLVAGQHSA
jgi:hypothetical protein